MKEISVIQTENVTGGRRRVGKAIYKSTKKAAEWLVSGAAYDAAKKAAKKISRKRANRGKPSGSCHTSPRTGQKYCTGGR